MKKEIFISLIFIITFSCATTIDEQIEAIKNAPEAKRIELMNKFKRQLVLMNQEQREKAIFNLKNNLTQNNNTPTPPVPPDSVINNMQSNAIEQNIQTINHQEIREITNFSPTIRHQQPTQIEPTNSRPITTPIIEPQQPTQIEQTNSIPTTPTIEPQQPTQTEQTNSIPTTQTTEPQQPTQTEQTNSEPATQSEQPTQTEHINSEPVTQSEQPTQTEQTTESQSQSVTSNSSSLSQGSHR